MANPSKRIGTEWANRVVRHLRSEGLVSDAIPQHGTVDEGDLWVQSKRGAWVMVEAKAEKAIHLSQYMAEAAVEREAFCEARGLNPELVPAVAIVKRRQHHVSRGYVVMELAEFARILRRL